MQQINLMFFGDVVGKIGRKALAKQLPVLKEQFKPDLTVANVENLAHGRGLTETTMKEIVEAGIDAFTSGHHVWENPQGIPILNDENWSKKLIRPANVDPKLAGQGIMRLKIKGQEIVIINLQGQLFVPQETSSPFLAFDRFWQEISAQNPKPLVVVDLHAEATSEKMAFANYVDGRANLVFGTHTHVPTADAKILPKGTGYCTDLGMVGLHDSVIGFEKNSSIKRFLGETQSAYELQNNGPAEINGLVAAFNLDTMSIISLTKIREIVDI
ncbi:MAG: TIGR00282 family metallophosphoesterase [Patescibacteria group bacterium]|nr:TIGR00282 family metallophosphoesterase [Patescibacteria group bacterium]